MVLTDLGLARPDLVAGAYATTVRAQAAILIVLNTQIDVLQEQVKANFGEHPDIEVYLSQPGLGFTLYDETTAWPPTKARSSDCTWGLSRTAL